MWTPPKMTRRGWRGNTSRKTFAGPAPASTVAVVLASRASAARAASRTASCGTAWPSVPSIRPSSKIRAERPASEPSRTVATTSPPGPRAAASTSGRTVGSTNTLIVPPQASPTSQARSWLTPKVTSLGVPRPIASPISVAVAPSTQPPETEPAIVPSAVASIDEPSGRGAEPHTLVTTARPSGRPWAARRS